VPRGLSIAAIVAGIIAGAVGFVMAVAIALCDSGSCPGDGTRHAWSAVMIGGVCLVVLGVLGLLLAAVRRRS